MPVVDRVRGERMDVAGLVVLAKGGEVAFEERSVGDLDVVEAEAGRKVHEAYAAALWAQKVPPVNGFLIIAGSCRVHGRRIDSCANAG